MILTELTADEVEARFSEAGLEPFRARQVLAWMYKHRAPDFGRMTDLSRELRDVLTREFRLYGAAVATRRLAADGTEKLLLRLADGNVIETVMIPEGRRITACISTQVGCPVACVFCASGLDGLKRNLTAGEIVEQILLLPKRPTHVVIMGIGEPLLNFTPLVAALRTMREAVGIGYNKITLSTAGVVDKIPELVKARATPNLAISLHAPDDALREKLVPGLSRWKIADLVAAGRAYREETGKDVTFEYVLLAGVNDAPEQATVLARRLRGASVKVNVIPFNGVPVTVRRQRGDDASAACGQLRAAFS